MIKHILSFINSGHPFNQTLTSSSPTWSSVSTAAQVGRWIKIGGSQSNLRNQRNSAQKTPEWRFQWEMTNLWFVPWLLQTPSLSKWLSEKAMKRVTLPSSAPVSCHRLWRPPHKKPWNRDWEKTNFERSHNTKCQRITSDYRHFWQQKHYGKSKSKKYCQLENCDVSAFQFLPFFLRTCVFPCVLLIVEAARIILLATWPFTKSYTIFSPPMGIAIVLKKQVENAFSWEVFLSGDIRNFERVRVLQSFHCTSCAQTSSPKPLPWTNGLARKTDI